ncbi:hypothetical protein Vretifemale_903, partial [Volvox reticuliferus]
LLRPVAAASAASASATAAATVSSSAVDTLANSSPVPGPPYQFMRASAISFTSHASCGHGGRSCAAGIVWISPEVHRALRELREHDCWTGTGKQEVWDLRPKIMFLGFAPVADVQRD